FKRQSTSSPNPSPLGRVIQSVREADTLAAEWQLPREWERRVGPETSRGRHHPKSALLWGSTPFLWARPKKWGGTGSTNLKSSRTKRRVPPTPPPQKKRETKDMRIICFGDSNTWGYDPRSYIGEQYPRNVRWQGRLAALPGLDVVN